LLYRAGFITDKKGLPADFDDSLKMKKSVWKYAKTRPANYPDKRIKGISKLLTYSLEFNGLCGLFQKITMDNYTGNPEKHQAIKFSNSIVEIFRKTKSLGAMRALEVCFNIILPFFIVLFREKGMNDYSSFLNKIFDVHPPLRDNSVTKKIANQLFANDLDKAKRIITSVKRYFGLIQIYYQDTQPKN